MATEAGIDESLLREQVRALLRDRCLPREQPAQMWGGQGSGACCDACGHPIREMDAEYELVFARVSDSSLRMHRPCYEIWESERRNTEN